MTGKTAGRQDISERLHQAIDGLRKDVARVEIWATALASFSQPVPDYEPDPKYQLGRPVNTDSLTKTQEETGPENNAANRPDKP